MLNRPYPIMLNGLNLIHGQSLLRNQRSLVQPRSSGLGLQVYYFNFSRTILHVYVKIKLLIIINCTRVRVGLVSTSFYHVLNKISKIAPSSYSLSLLIVMSKGKAIIMKDKKQKERRSQFRFSFVTLKKPPRYSLCIL